MTDVVVLRRESPSDHDAAERLQRAAFGDPDELPSLVMLSAGRLDAPQRLVDVLVLSPLGVLPTHQGRGIGTQLINEALTTADEMEVPLVFLEGDPDYYATRGFERADLRGFRSPSLRIPEPAFQVALMSAYELWMTGTLVYSDIFWELDCVGLRDDHD